MRAADTGVPGLRHLAQHGFGERSGARATARKRHQNYRAIRAGRLDAAAVGIGLARLQWRVLDMGAGATCGRQNEQWQQKSPVHLAHSMSRASCPLYVLLNGMVSGWPGAVPLTTPYQ